MKKNSFFLILAFANLSAQVGINTKTPSATLDIRAKNHLGTNTAKDGVLVPRVNNLTTNGSVNGQMVFLIADNSGYTKGFHYWDSTKSKWINISSVVGDPTDDAWIDDSTNSMVKLATLSDGTTSRTASNSIVVLDNGNVGVGNINPKTKLDLRTNPGNANPGEGAIGIGENPLSATDAGAGAIRYNATSKKIEYSNQTVWNVLETPTYNKTIVVAKFNSEVSSPSFSNNTETTVAGWNKKLIDINNNFNASTGVFTAPRTADYQVSFSFNFTSSSIGSNSRVEAILKSSNSSILRKGVVSFPKNGTAQAGASVSFQVKLAVNETIYPVIYHNLGGSKTFRLGNNNADDGFVNFSVVEL